MSSSSTGRSFSVVLVRAARTVFALLISYPIGGTSSGCASERQMLRSLLLVLVISAVLHLVPAADPAWKQILSDEGPVCRSAAFLGLMAPQDRHHRHWLRRACSA